MRHTIAEQFNFTQPGLKGCKQTDFVISQYNKEEYKMCSLDVVNAVAYLAFLDPEDAKKMDFSTEYLFTLRNKLHDESRKED